MMVFIMIFIAIPFFVIGQDSITINSSKKSIIIRVASSGLVDEDKNLFCDDDVFIESDTSYIRYYYDCEKNRLEITDTFHYISTSVVRKKNSIFIVPRSRKKYVCLDEQLKNLTFQEKDSLLNITLRDQYKWSFSRFNMRKHYEISPVMYYENKYPYIDIKEVFKEQYKKRNLYTSLITRILVINGVHYVISVKSESLKSARSIASSRRAVCKDFKQLVSNVQIIGG